MNSVARAGVCVVLGAAGGAAARPEILVDSWGTSSVRRHDLATGAYLGDFVPPGSGGLQRPDGLDWGADGRLYVASALNHRVLRYNGQNGAFIDTFIGVGLNDPGYLQFGPDGRLYVCDKGTGRVLRFNEATGALLGVAAQGGGLSYPAGLAWTDGLLWVSGFGSSAIHRYNPVNGAFVGQFVAHPTPLQLRLGTANDIWVSSHDIDALTRYDRATGQAIGMITTGLDCPVAHVIAPDGTLLVASYGNHAIMRYNGATGAFTGVFASGNGLVLPNDLLFRAEVCYPDCNGDTQLTVADFGCVQTRFVLGQFYADCNADGALTVADFGCYQTKFVAGCP